MRGVRGVARNVSTILLSAFVHTRVGCACECVLRSVVLLLLCVKRGFVLLTDGVSLVNQHLQWVCNKYG